MNKDHVHEDMQASKFQSVSVLMFAPGHDILDNRVNRTATVIQREIKNIKVYYEAHRIVDGTNNSTNSEGVEIKSMPKVSIHMFRHIWNEIRQARSNNAILISYIHDSGLVGLLIAVLASFTKRSTDRIYFDYHDVLEWELHHHLGKVFKFSILRRFVVAIINFFIKIFIRFFADIDLIIGISEGQVNQLRSKYGISSSRILIVPNTRARIASNGLRSGPMAILWVGNVSNGRGFEAVFDLKRGVEKSSSGIKPEIILLGKNFSTASEAIASEEPIVNLGAFSSDYDIVNRTKNWTTVGVFFGWNDKHNTSINEVSSVNKVYSYINSLTPFLLPANQTNMINEHNIPKEFTFNNNDELIERFNWISANYTHAQKKVAEIKARTFWNEEVEAVLKTSLIYDIQTDLVS